MTWLSLAISAVWMAGFWVMSRDRSDTWAITLIGMVASLIAVGLIADNIWANVKANYPGDSFWTLGWGGRVGVLAISTIGITLIFLFLAWKTRIILRMTRQATGMAWMIIDVVLGLMFFAVVFSASPQVFYSFYRLIIPGLPQQWVIDGPINIERLGQIVTLAIDGHLADHLAGLAFWAIVPFTVWLHQRYWWRGGNGA
ncbi:MAG: hypothetical protein AAFP98_12975 [Pseudomonadota bacterium]